MNLGQLHVNMAGVSHMTIQDSKKCPSLELDVKFYMDKHEISWSSSLI